MLCYVSLLSAAGMNLFPKPQTVFLNHTGKFTCDAINIDFTFWRVNGTNIRDIHVEVDGLKSTQRSGNAPSTLTLTARADYNGTTVQCVTADAGRVPVLVESENVTLTIQGS